MKTYTLFAFALLMVTPLFAFQDKNPDCLSDVFEFIYFNGPADPYADADGDGVSNYDEMVWGTNPTNAASKVTGPSAKLIGHDLQFTWPAAPYRNYELRASEDLVSWQIVASGAISNYTENLSAPNAPAKRYYRLSVSFQSSSSGSISGLTATRIGSDLVLNWTMDSSRVYQLLSGTNFANWSIESTNAVSPYTQSLAAPNLPRNKFYHLSATGGGSTLAPDGLELWEEALYLQTFRVLPAQRDSDGDGMNDLQEFQLGLMPGKKDHPAVGLVVFTPLEK